VGILNQEAPTVKVGGPIGPRTEVAEPSKSRIGYAFDAVPKFLSEMIRDGRLKATDELVLTQLLRFRSRVKDSCWTVKAVVAKATGLSPRTVQRSFARLSAAKVIEHRPVECPDPDEPQNQTGWRIGFVWLAPKGHVPGPGVTRAGRGKKTVGTPDANWETSVSPPPAVSGETSVSPPPETSVSPKATPTGVRRSLTETDRQTTSSSSSREDDGRPVDRPGETLEQSEKFRDAVGAVLVCFGPELADALKTDRERIGARIQFRWDLFVGAIYATHCAAHSGGDEPKKPKKPLSYAAGIVVRDYALAGVVPGEVVLYQKQVNAAFDARVEEDAKAQQVAERIVEVWENLGWRFILTSTGSGDSFEVLPTRDDCQDAGEAIKDVARRNVYRIITFLKSRPPVTADERARFRAIWDARAAERRESYRAYEEATRRAAEQRAGQHGGSHS
jgi:hypothetical protein